MNIPDDPSPPWTPATLESLSAARPVSDEASEERAEFQRRVRYLAGKRVFDALTALGCDRALANRITPAVMWAAIVPSSTDGEVADSQICEFAILFADRLTLAVKAQLEGAARVAPAPYTHPWCPPVAAAWRALNLVGAPLDQLDAFAVYLTDDAPSADDTADVARVLVMRAPAGAAVTGGESLDAARLKDCETWWFNAKGEPLSATLDNAPLAHSWRCAGSLASMRSAILASGSSFIVGSDA